MKTLALTLAGAAVLAAAGATGLAAHQTRGSMMQQAQPDVGQMMPYQYPGAPGTMMGPGYMMGGGMMGGGMMGHGMEHMMVVMMDTDGDGALSLEEFQAVHNRMFNAMDINGDGKLTSEEMEEFAGNAWMVPQQDQ